MSALGSTAAPDLDAAQAIRDRVAAREEWRVYWPLVLASTIGFSLHTVSSYALGLFIVPIEAEYGWARAQISVASLIPAVIMVLFSPYVGGLVDRVGSRSLALPSIALTGLALAAIGVLTTSFWVWALLWLVYGVISLGTKATVWTTAISVAFDKGRGLALGLALCGTAVTQIVVPPLTQWLIGSQGWRAAYVCLGLGWSAPCFIACLFFLFDAHSRRQRTAAKSDAPAAAPALTGITLGQALRTPAFLRIAASTLLTMFITSALLIHQVPILIATGVPAIEAAWLASLAGVAGVAGKLATGWMVDRWDAGWVGAVTLSTPALAYVVLMQEASLALNVGAMMIIGYTTGAKLQISAYLTSCFVGRRHFGKISGVVTSIIGIGGGFGAVAAGAVYDAFGSYDAILIIGIVTSLICGLLVFRLGPYPDWSAAPAPGRAA